MLGDDILQRNIALEESLLIHDTLSVRTTSSISGSVQSRTSAWKKLSMFKSESAAPSTKEMLSCYAKITVPITLSNLIGQMILFMNTVFAGQMNDEVSLAAVGLGEVCTHILVLTFLIGLNNTQETLTSQAFGSG